MRKIYLFLFLMCLTVSMMAQTAWTVQTVPNTRLESNDIHVSDPDGYLSDSTEMAINTALCAIREQADVFVVTLASIGDAEPKHFATRLFNYWGIGDAETDNGVLLLFVEDQHALEFETGYGAEATMTDAKCERIFTKTIVPYFRAGDYEGGLCAGVADIVEVYGGEIPMGLKTTLPTQMENDTAGDADEDIGKFLFLGLFGLFLFAMPFVGLLFWAAKHKAGKVPVSDSCHTYEEGNTTYIDELKTSWSGSPWEGKGCLGGMLIGLSIFVILFLVIGFMMTRFPDMEDGKFFNRVALITLLLYLTWVCFRHNQRVLKEASKLAETSASPRSVYQSAFNHTSNKIAMWMAPWLGWIYYSILKKKVDKSDDCLCPKCKATMKHYSGFAMPQMHAVESQIEALRFRPYRCSNGHEVVVKEKGKRFDKFKTCEKCGALAMKRTNVETIKAADYSHSGESKETYVCQYCGETLTKRVVIPMLVRHYSSGSSYGSSSSSSSRSYSSHHSSSHSSGGSFGGGRSGGGGYSGRW